MTAPVLYMDHCLQNACHCSGLAPTPIFGGSIFNFCSVGAGPEWTALSCMVSCWVRAAANSTPRSGDFHSQSSYGHEIEGMVVVSDYNM